MDIYTHALESSKKASVNIFANLQNTTKSVEHLSLMAQNYGTNYKKRIPFSILNYQLW